MSGFLSVYEGTERVDLGRGYWADVKKCLSTAEMGFTQAAMGADRQHVNVADTSDHSVDLNILAFRVEMVVQSLDAWNLDDGDGSPWPLHAGQVMVRPGDNPYPEGCPRRVSVARLPSTVFDMIWSVVDNRNGPGAPGDKARFPGEPERGDTDGDAGATDPGPVPGGTRVLAEAGVAEEHPTGGPAA